MTGLMVVLLLGLVVGIFVLQSNGGKIFNNLFMKSKVESGRAEMRRELTWSSPHSAETVITALKEELALSAEKKLASKTYTMGASDPTAMVISYGNKVFEAFRVLVSTTRTPDGHAGKFEVVNFTEADSMPVDVDKLVKLREKVSATVRSQGAVVS